KIKRRTISSRARPCTIDVNAPKATFLCACTAEKLPVMGLETLRSPPLEHLSADFLAGHQLILGGCGFIGRHVAALLAQRGHRVVLADRSQMAIDFPSGLRDRIVWRPFDFATANWDNLLEGASVIYHFAWSSIPASANSAPAEDLAAN